MIVMGNAEYMVVCYVAAALCILSFLITLFIFFKLNIIGVIGDLSGSTARKGIESIRNENARTGNKAHKTSHINRERGRLTDRITPSGNLSPQGEEVRLSTGTEKFNTGKLKDVAYGSETTVLNGCNGDETTVLANNYNVETTLLSYNYAVNDFVLKDQLANAGIVVEDEIIFVHSNERIN